MHTLDVSSVVLIAGLESQVADNHILDASVRNAHEGARRLIEHQHLRLMQRR